jgi:hypothetical protein
VLDVGGSGVDDVREERICVMDRTEEASSSSSA